MTRLVAVVLGVVFAFAGTPSVHTSTSTENAWLIVVDDLHVPFAQTGRLRDLLRRVAAELIQEGDRHLFRASGPSGTSLTSEALTDDRSLAASAIKFMTGNGLKDWDIFVALPGASAADEVVYRANTALDAADDAIYVLTRDAAPRQAIVYVSGGYDVESYPAIAARVRAFARRARENNITIFPIDARGFGSLIEPDPRLDADTLLRYTTALRRSLTVMAEETGGFVIERPNEPASGLKHIAEQMR